MHTTIAYFARHGQTTLNASNCFRGHLNPDLDAKGRQDAKELADYFAPIDLAAIFYSDKNRSTETADIISKNHPNVESFGTNALWPLNVGDFSGKKKDAETQAQMDWYVDNPSVQIPGGESLNDFKGRIRPCIVEALKLADMAGKPVLVVAHSSVMHEVSSMFAGHHHAALVKPGGVIEVSEENGRIVARPIIKPDVVNIGSRQDTIS